MRQVLGEGQSVQDEEMMTEVWRKRNLEVDRTTEEQDLHCRPSKRTKRTMEETWGLEDRTEEQENLRRWLLSPGAGVTTGEKRQTTLRRWTWLEVEARRIILELADCIEKKYFREKEQEENSNTVPGEDVDILNAIETREQHQVVTEPMESRVESLTVNGEQQTVADMWATQELKQRAEQARRQRLELGETKRAALILKLQPWRWLEQEARTIVLEVVSTAVEVVRSRKMEESELKRKLLQKKQQEKKSRKKKTESLLTLEARKVVLELVRDVEKQGRLKLGEKKKKELLRKLESKNKVKMLAKNDIRSKEQARQERIKLGENKKRELLKKLEIKSRSKAQENVQGMGEQEWGKNIVAGEDDYVLIGNEQEVAGRASNQLLRIHIVSGDRAGSRKRTRSRRGGMWASWLKDDLMSNMPRSKRRALRRSKGEQYVHCLVSRLASLEINKENGLGDILHSFRELSTEEQANTVEMMDISPNIPSQGGSRKKEIFAWESEENVWLTRVALGIGGEVLEDFLRIEEQQPSNLSMMRYGQEISDHQKLEEMIDSFGLPRKEYILDSFNTGLSKRAKDCLTVQGIRYH